MSVLVPTGGGGPLQSVLTLIATYAEADGSLTWTTRIRSVSTGHVADMAYRGHREILYVSTRWRIGGKGRYRMSIPYLAYRGIRGLHYVSTGHSVSGA
eukprot:3680583-Rhodomonas_salina.1